MKKNAVTVIGSINYDIILKQKRLPVIGETFSADSVTFSSGGKGANQAVQCAKLGLETYMVGKVGNDYFGRESLANLEKFSVKMDFITLADTVTGLGIVNSLEDGRLGSTISKGANYSISYEDINQAEQIIKKSQIVILQLEIPKEIVEYTIQLAKKHDCYVILNAAPASEIDRKYLKMVDCFVVNETEASYYSEETVTTVEEAMLVCEKLYHYANDLLVITLGEKGSVLYDGNQKKFFPANKVDVVETTGAGDSYVGALAYGILKGKSHDELGEFTSLVSSRTVTKIGGQEAMPNIEELNN